MLSYPLDFPSFGGPDSGTAFNWWLMDSELVRTGRDRLLRVFRYLEALNEHRNPVKRHLDQQLWTLWLRDLPDHPSVRRGTPANGAAKSSSVR